MARPPKSTQEPIANEPSGKFVLKKNHGLLVNGRTSQFYEAGTEFDPETDSDLITRLIQSGAVLE